MKTIYNFQNKHYILTGASSGIGQQCALDLMPTGARLTLIGRNIEKLNATKNKDQSAKVEVLFGDLCDEKFVDIIAESTSNLDGIVLCAGVIDYTPAKMISREKIRRVFDINFEANVILIQALLKRRKINPNASVIIISSISSKLGVAGTSLYAASKAAITAYAKVLATELSVRKIRVNVIHPGIVKTNLISDSEMIENSALVELEKRYPLGFGRSEDVASQVKFLLSEESKWITGTEIIMDGGHTIGR
jgi:NAD(P)-dependent dehydrogenase (short-subunit alcohol dehydrogenase family)